jgi:prepilin-type processing-associated H-X9-DG protein
MEENYVGYVLNALDAQTHHEVKEHLLRHPEDHRQVDLIRQALEPLAADAEEIEPPRDLAVRTLARIAEFSCRELPRTPAPAPRRSEFTYQRWWQRADVLVAASLFLCVTLLIPPLINHLNHEHQRESCKNNLRQFGEALIVYSDQHGGRFPNVADLAVPPSRQVAGAVIPLLIDEGELKKGDVTVVCPANGPPRGCPWTLADLGRMSRHEFEKAAPLLSCCYGYSLGYRDAEGKVAAFRHGGFPVPLMADRPPFREGSADPSANSPNHGGEGQNVLFTDGHVEYLTKNTYRGDNFYVNHEGLPRAGVNQDDPVVGISEASPLP